MGIVAAVVLVVPGAFLGGLAVIVYTFFSDISMQRYGSGPGWIPFLDGIFAVWWFLVLPEGIRFFVAVGAAVYVALLIFKKADPVAVGISAASVWIIVGLGMALFVTISGGWSPVLFGFLGGMAGAAFGASAAVSSR